MVHTVTTHHTEVILLVMVRELMVAMVMIIMVTRQVYGVVNKCCGEGEIFYQDMQRCGEIQVGRW